MEKHLKSKQYYLDLYDRHTVEQCRRSEKFFDQDDILPSATDEAEKQEAKRIKKTALELSLYFEKGDRYLNKEKVIREWMDADQKRDELYESAEAPEDIRCLTCRNRLKPTFKQLWSHLDKPDRILFMYDCPNKCLPRRAFFSDGEEWRVKPTLCFKCNTPVKSTSDDDGKTVITTNTCPSCGYTEKDVFEWSSSKEEELDEHFAKDRDRFCLTSEEGEKYRQEKWGLEHIAKLSEELNKKEEERKEKLKQNPQGFHLEGRFTCAICNNTASEGDNWYDTYGIKCLICQNAIDRGEIPPTLAQDKDLYYTTYDLDSSFNLKAPTLRKWIKEGTITPRTITKYGTGIHIQLFLIQDNIHFLPPKNLVKSEAIKQRRDGKDWYTTAHWYELHNPIQHLKGYKIMDHLRVIPTEEMKERGEVEKEKEDGKRGRRKAYKKSDH